MGNIDLCIIGNGPAGLTAAIYAARYGIKQVLVGDLPGGLMTSSHKICNYPSEKEISGMELSQKMVDQVNFLSVPQIMAQVKSISKIDDSYQLDLSNGENIIAKTILIATGTKHRHLNLSREKELIGKGVSYCATCDGMFYKNKVVAVVGGSDSANTSSLYLSQVANMVYQIYRKDALRGETAWINQIKNNQKVKVIYNNEITELIGEEKLLAIELKNEFEGKTKIIIDGLFIEIGSEPDLNLSKQLNLKTDKGGYILTNQDQITSQKGVWAAGDITTNSNSFRQIITACAEGAIATENIFKFLNK
ncbi:MAG: FAD-dependent oxidoreductase [Patescibacteria group bacterium]|nr:FAD-dependent oxidoreductase [Patescibacteria group bacterium]